MARIPARLLDAPKVLLAHAREVTDGDWSRVTWENGQLTIHNQAPKVQKPPRPSAKKAEKKAAKKAAPAPKPERKLAVVEDPRNLEPESHPKVYEQKLPQPKQEKLPKHLTPEPVRMRQTRPAPEPAPIAEPPKTTPTVRDRLSDAERRAAQQMRAPLKKYDMPVPKGFRIEDAWENLDIDRVASSMLEACRKGLPMSLPLNLHPDVLALEGLQEDLVVASVRKPHHVEIAGMETKEKGFVVLRFYRGDITTVVGMRDQGFPMIIATYAISILSHDTHRVGTSKGGGGGGGARRQSGLPRTPAAVQKRLVGAGAEVRYDELHGGNTAEVFYRGQSLGKMSMTKRGADCESDYQRMIRKMEAIARRSA